MARDPSTSNGSRGKPPSRTVKKVAAVSGASKTNPDIPSQALKNSRIHLNGADAIFGADDFSRDVKYQATANPSQRGYISPGLQSKLGESWVVGRLKPRPVPGIDLMSSLSGDLKAGNYGFEFHYNPTSVTITAVGGEDFAPSQLDTLRGLTISNSTVSFQVLLNRSEDIADKNPLGSSILSKTTFDELGTQYDLEWLFRTVNGIFKSDSDTQSADIGVLLPTPLTLELGGAIKYPVFLSGFTVEHLKFTPGMIPMLSLLDMTCTRITNAQIPNGNLDPTTKTPATPAPSVRPPQPHHMIGTDKHGHRTTIGHAGLNPAVYK